MASDLRKTQTPSKTQVELRVRYTDCDPMGVAHHSVYPVWLEIARGELLRRHGTPYSELEQQGVLFVVARMSIRYRQPARYDDLLCVNIWEPAEAKRRLVKVDHTYEILRDHDLLATAETTLVCVDRQGNPQAIPPGSIG